MSPNQTYKILKHARENNYAVPAVCVYNLEGIMATIRAAEESQSPVIIQLFPWALHFYHRQFVQYVADIAHGARVPIALHLDHCVKESDAELALTLPFDSIMIDGSAFEVEEDALAYCSRMTKAAVAVGKTVEVELGRMEGGEDGLPSFELDKVLTRSEDVAEIVKRVGLHYLAPSFGNIHGPYGPKGPRWDIERVERIRQELPNDVSMVLHGCNGITDDHFRLAVSLGFTKININKGCRVKTTKYLQEQAGRVELTQQLERTVTIYSDEIRHFMNVMGSAGKA